MSKMKEYLSDDFVAEETQYLLEEEDLYALYLRSEERVRQEVQELGTEAVGIQNSKGSNDSVQDV